jgi:hypothetical protein
MMNYIKSVTLWGVVAGLVLAPASSLSAVSIGGAHSASASFNDDAQDYPTLRVSNYSQNPGSSTAWTNSIQNVRVGDVVSFRFYYHNTSGVTANNTRASISFNYNASNVVATGKIWANNASPVYGTASAYTAGSIGNLSLTFNSAQWYPNQDSAHPDPLPNGQSGAEVVTANGVSIGNIAGGWSSQGYLVVLFTVNGDEATTNTSGANGAACINVDAPSTVTPGQSFTAKVNMSNNGTKPWTGSYRLGSQNPQDNTTWGMNRVYLPGHWVYPGGSALFSLNATAPTTPGTYAFDWKMLEENVEWFGATCTKTITVLGGSTNASSDFSVSVSPSAQNVTKPGQVTYTVYVNAVSGTPGPVTLSFLPNGTGISGWFSAQTISPGNSSVLTVVVSSNAPDGVQNALVRGTANGVSHDAPLSVNVSSASQATLTITPGSATIQTGQTAQFYALYDADGPSGAQGAQDVSYSANWSSSQYGVATSYSNGKFYGNAQGLNATAFLSVNGNGAQTYSIPLVETDYASNISGSSATLTGWVNPSGAQTSYRFEYGTNFSLGSATQFTTIGSGNADQFVSSPLSGLSPNTTYYFRVTAQNGHGTAYGQILSFTTSNGNQNTYGTAPFVVTNPAAYISTGSALVNGSASSNYGVSSEWFEYGTTQSLGSQTGAQPGGNGGNFSFALLNLLPNTTYYFRAVAMNQYGTGYGSVLSFSTNAVSVATPTPTPPVVVTPPPAQTIFVTNNNIGSGSCATLLPMVSSPSVKTGEEFDYSITYRNDCAFDLQSASLSVVFPGEATLIASNLPFAIQDADTRVFNLGVVPKEYQGTITLRTKLNNVGGGDGTALYGATLSFRDSKSKLQDVVAYISVAVTAAGVVGLASVLGILEGLSWWWLLILILVALGLYWYYRNKRQ